MTENFNAVTVSAPLEGASVRSVMTCVMTCVAGLVTFFTSTPKNSPPPRPSVHEPSFPWFYFLMSVCPSANRGGPAALWGTERGTVELSGVFTLKAREITVNGARARWHPGGENSAKTNSPFLFCLLISHRCLASYIHHNSHKYVVKVSKVINESVKCELGFGLMISTQKGEIEHVRVYKIRNCISWACHDSDDSWQVMLCLIRIDHKHRCAKQTRNSLCPDEVNS